METMTKKVYVEIPDFTGENIPVATAARIMNKDVNYVRQGLIQGILDFGYAFKKEGSNQYDYYISPMKFWQATGWIYKQDESSLISDEKSQEAV